MRRVGSCWAGGALLSFLAPWNCSEAFVHDRLPSRTTTIAINWGPQQLETSDFASLSRLSPTSRRRWTMTSMAAPLVVPTLTPNSLFLVRIVFLRAVAFVHAVAFLVAYRQNKALIGDNGITPAKHVLRQATDRGERKMARRLVWYSETASSSLQQAPTDEPVLSPFRWLVLGLQRCKFNATRAISRWIDTRPRLRQIRQVCWDRTDSMDRPLPTVLWLARDRHRLNRWLDGLALCGLATSLSILLSGAANVPLMLTLWVCQRSLMSVGGPWYGFGWEPQLAELSFHALFLVPLFDLRQIPTLPVPPLVRWTIQWYLFRIMIGAGLIKLKSNDRKWKDLTAMNYFYETQPVPNPLTRYMHWMPTAWHKVEVVVNHIVENVAPWLLIIPRLPVSMRRVGGWTQILFQAVLISSGNLSFLNWLTMVPAIMCFDDALLAPLFTSGTRQRAAEAVAASNFPLSQQIVSGLFFVLILQLSVPVVRNLCSRRQVMNSSFDPLRLVNTYGAFGTVSERREELVVSATNDKNMEVWDEYEFKVKPGNVTRSPRWIAPYHYRLDWQMWIAAQLKRPDRSPWIFTFLLKLLQRDRITVALLERDPFRGVSIGPKYIRIDLYEYRFHRPAKDERDPPYWDRSFVRRIYPRQGVAGVDDLKEEIRRYQR